MNEMENANSIESRLPPGSSDGSQQAGSGKMENGDLKSVHNETARATKARKRTKTGCLTCRKRRIKCGEERPTCANCVKSRRSCEGYAPRLTFRDPLSAIVPGWQVREHFSIPTGNGVAGQVARSANGNQLPAILPRPMPIPQLPLPPAPPSHTQPLSKPLVNGFQPTANGFNVPTSNSELPPPRLHEPYRGPDSQTQQIEQGSNGTSGTRFVVSEPQQVAQYPVENGNNRQAAYDTQWLQQSAPPPPIQENELNQLHFFHPPIDHVPEQAVFSGTQYSIPQTTAPDTSFSLASINGPNISLPEYNLTKEQPQNVVDYQNMPYSQPQHEHWVEARVEEPPSHFQANHATAHHQYYPTEYDKVMNNQADGQKNQGYPPNPSSYIAVEPEDDYWDVMTDEEDNDGDTRIAATPQNDLGLMLALSASRDDTAPRSFTTFLDQPNVLARYIPRFNASPLMDATTARIFCHFITSTGPTLSIYERHPANPMLMFSGAPVPASQQALWTYTLPMMALANQALLHAMLGLASLHIARLQNSSLTSSLRHYHYAIRRIAKAVATPSHRVDIGTIAATLILSFYEAGTAEHSKWNSHLTGARQLLMEVDFKGQTRRIKEEKARMETNRASSLGSLWQSPPYGNPIYNNYSNHIASQLNDVDEVLISKLMGWKVRYDEFGRIIEDEPEKLSKRPLTPKDVERYKILCDLFWWYCKQDVYQSVVSGNRLLLPYSRWGHCPPRAPIGRFNATYGTMDHLILLMGRVADFSSRDQLRKRKAVKANGGHWRPPPGMFPGGPPGPPPGTQGPPPSMPPPPPANAPTPMYGMMPAIVPPPLPDAFRSAPRDQLYFAQPMSEDDIMLENSTLEAEAEWEEISKALKLFEASLGEEFQPLSPDIMPPTQTPFGDSIEYRTYPIACIWTMFYTGRIITARMHPSMPPAAMMAAGIAAPETSHWAQLIGRICAGLQPPPSNQPLNPSLGAALMESSLGLFFAGVQYQDHAQRSYIVHILRRITVLTGWSSSALIAAGCEVTWIKTHEAGRGPPYQRTKDISEVDDRTNVSTSDGAENNGDRALIEINPGIRVHYAMGIMSVEEDFKEMSLSEKR